MAHNRAIAAWEEYRAKVYETDKPLVLMQERECSLAFYMGMISAFAEFAAIAGDPNNVSDEALDAGAYQLEIYRREIDRAAAKANLDRNTGKS